MSYETKPIAEYVTLQDAFDFYNGRLWRGTLPPVQIAFLRKKRNHGYYRHDVYTERSSAGGMLSEITLNPDRFGEHNDEWILSVLVHEMAHLWQYCAGKPSRGGYHNAEWGREMDRIGLTPSNTGQPGGKRTGQQMLHIIVADGPFADATAELLAQGLRLRWTSTERDASGKEKKPDDSKTPYVCSSCGWKLWSKPGLQATCSCGGVFATEAAG